MSLNATPSANRTRIGIFGRRNAGKSSLINALTGQDLAVVSETKGTTTDPVKKAMELLPLGPVVLVDTPGLDDEGELGQKRMDKALEELRRTDIALLVVDAAEGLAEADRALLERIRGMEIPCLVVWNKCDAGDCPLPESLAERAVCVSARTKRGIDALKERIAHLNPGESGRRLIADLLQPGDLVILVVPIDKAAPKGRLILPQQQTIRDILEAGALSLTVRETELPQALAACREKPRMVVTDSQVFAKVAQDTPQDVALTSFSILMARYKGYLDAALRSIPAVESLRDGDTVLIAEGCTHHRTCEDIGTVKLPRLIRAISGAEPQFAFTSGRDFPDDLSPYAAIVHCGGCTLNARDMASRLQRARAQQAPFTNYGMTIARAHNILPRALAPLE